MFRKFVAEEQVSSQSKVKSSVQRAILRKIKDQYEPHGLTDELLEALLPKKSPMIIAKCQNHINLIFAEGSEVVFFNQRDGPYYPTLKTLHKAGDIMPKIQVDKGAIKHVIQGANIMCQGITSGGGKVFEPLPADTPIQIMAEDKELPLAIGITRLSTDDIIKVNKGIGIESIHVLGDGLWTLDLE